MKNPILKVDRIVYLPTSDRNTTVATLQHAWILTVGRAKVEFDWTRRPDPASIPHWVDRVRKVPS